jgi:peptide-methionine (R)-S-oxide reductase
MTKVEKSEQEWREQLTPEEYRVLRQKGTEAPFSGEYDHVFEPGTYRCAGCGAELFDSEAKYDSGCGWPAFYAPAGEEAIDEETDTSHGMVRTEVLCSNCGGHLGHVFRCRARAVSSAGRAPALQAGGRRFDPVTAHSDSVASRQHWTPYGHRNGRGDKCGGSPSWCWWRRWAGSW